MKCSKSGCLNPARRMEVIKNTVTGQKHSKRYCMEHLHLSRHIIPVWILVNDTLFIRCTYTLIGLDVNIYEIGDYE